MLDAAALHAASDCLWRHWREGTTLAELPAGCRPATRGEGYRIQALLEARSGSPLFGWKIAATSAAGQAHINVDGPLAGRIIRENVFDSGADVPLGANRMRVAEPEFAFRMARDLPPRRHPYSTQEVVDAVAALHPAIELPDSRYQDFTAVGPAQLIADDACAHLFVLGDAAASDWRRVDLAAHRVIGRVGDRLTREGEGANVLSGPLDALAWLANELSGLGVALKAGEVVTTGTCMAPLPIGPGDAVGADFGELGRVSVRLI